VNISSKRSGFILFLSLSITILLYWPGLNGPLMLDDGPQVMPIMNNFETLGWLDTFKQYVLSNSGFLKRPVSMVSFVLNAGISKTDIWYWKLTNVVLHIICGILVYMLTRSILVLLKWSDSSNINIISLLITIVWVFHPLQVSSVLYLVQRMTILVSIFMFSALYCYVNAIRKEADGKSGSVFFILSFLVFFPLSVLSKESGVLFPLYILLIDHLCKLRVKDMAAIGRLKRRWFLTGVYSTLIVGGGLFIVLYGRIVSDGYLFRSFTLYERLITEPRVLLMYLQQILFPLPSTMGFFHDDILISKSIFHPISTLLSAVAVFGIIAFSFYSLRAKKLLGFGILIFFASHLLESTVIPLEIAFEHRNYFGLWGVAVALLPYLSKYTKLLVTAGLSIVLFLSGATLYRSSVWGDASMMYPKMLSIHPGSLRLKSIFSATYSDAGLYDKARSYLMGEKGMGAELQLMVIECRESGHIDNHAFMKLSGLPDIRVSNYEIEGIIELANMGLDDLCQIDANEFVNFIDQVLTKPVVNKVAEQKLLLYKAHFEHKSHKIPEAISALSESWARDMSNPIPLFLQVEWLVDDNQHDRAEQVYQKAKMLALESWYDYSEFIVAGEVKLSEE